MKLKTIEVNGETYAAVQDGKPVYVHDDGKEVGFDAAGTVATISRLNGEAKGHREAKEAAERALKAFEGVDPAAARKAISLTEGMDEATLKDARNLEKIREEAARARDEAVKAVRREFEPVVAERDSAMKRMQDMQIGLAFRESKFLADKVVVPVDLIKATFGGAFSVDDNGRVVAKGPDGNPIYSRAVPGQFADFDEAMETLIGAYPHRDAILKGANPGGGGTRQTNGQSGSKQMTRSEFDKLAPTDRMAKMREGVALVDG